MTEADRTVEQTAEHFQVHANTIRLWLGRGQFPTAYKLPGKAGWRIPQADIDALKKAAA